MTAGDIVSELQAALGPGRVTPADRAPREQWHDRWVLSDLDDLEGAEVPRAACIAFPTDVPQVVAVVNACRESGTPLTPVGLRSGVCGGVRARKGAVQLDLSGLDAVHEINETNLTARFGAGLRGSEAERVVAQRGLTIGHFPQSIELSSVGGWVATRAAGQLSTGYGNIEDMLLQLEVVLPNGTVARLGKSPRASAGPDLRQLFLGSEGCLGVITDVTLSLRREPEKRALAAYHLPTMAAGFEAQRQILQAGWAPVVLRQYDPPEVGRLFAKYRREGRCLLLAVHEGPAARVEAESAALAAIALQCDGSVAPAEATESWLEKRNHVPTFKSFLERGIIVDTIEVAAAFDQITQVYERAVAALSRVPGIWNGSAHSSHAYRNGLNLYFSFAVQPQGESTLRGAYEQCWSAVMEATLGAGGTIAHHHGIGRVRRDWLEAELGPTGLALLRSVKHSLDPTGFMNPGVLLPEPVGASAAPSR